MAEGTFRKGAAALQEASKGGRFARTEYFSLEDGKTAVLRFLTDGDDWISVNQHQVIPTKPKADDWPKDSNWPDKMGAVCRRDQAFSYGECYICDFLVDGKKIKRPSARGWALACIREEVIGDGSDELGGPANKGKSLGYRDAIREVTRKKGDSDETETVKEKAIVVVNMGWQNFFSVLDGLRGFYGGTILDRDIVIKRNGNDKDTKYAMVGLDPIRKADGSVLDLRNPEDMARYEHDLNLEEIISDRASDDFYARFFDPRFTPSKKDGDKPSETGAAPAAPGVDNDVNAEKMEALRNRVMQGYGSNGGEAPADAAPAAEPPAEPAAPAEPAPAGPRDFG